MTYKDFPTPDKDFLKNYTALWTTMAQVGIRCRIRYTPEFARDGNYHLGAANYRIINQQERKAVINNHGNKEKTSRQS